MMTRRILHIAFLLLALSAIGLKAQQNPILPGFHADPEVLYSHLTHRYYIYSTTDGTPHWGGYTYRCYSSADLKEWRDEGDVLNARDGQIHKKTQCAALPNAVHCISRCSTLRWPMQRTATFGR
ncbi:MAG: family 43 glycosylhydrolase [Bacteroidaceae bacterium]|nr:family 43 glycosylhydrolase [Bacteroidaceae bacterium]